MFRLIKKIKLRYLLKPAKLSQQPLLNNKEILALLFRVQSKNKAHHPKHDISFRKLGDIRSVFRGQGMDYEESRQYQSGDDPRYMNWQLSARTGQHYMKVFREERQPGVFILIDRRDTMRFGTRKRLKVTQAVRVAATAGFSAQEKNFSIGGIILDKELEWFKENHNKQAVFDFIHRAARPAQPIFKKIKNEKYTINDVLRMLTETLTPGSKIYLVSDFHDINKESQSILLQLSYKHDVKAIQITDKAEVQLPFAGNISLKSVMSNKFYNLNSNSLPEQKKYQAAAKEYFSEKKQIFDSVNLSYKNIFTTDDNIDIK